MDESLELSIRVRFEGGDAFPSSFITQSLNVVEGEVFQLEYDELEEIFKVLDDIPNVIKDACYHRIRRYDGNSLLLEKASNGSIILAGVSAALAYWIVENTIGESIKDAYKQSELHDKLKGLLLRRFPSRNKELSRRLNQRFFVPISDPVVIADIRIAANDPTVLEVNLRLNRWERVPPRPTQWAFPANDEKF